MSEMVERVARALHKAHYDRGRGIAPSYDLLNKWEREMWVFSARAAIAAMREPTEVMVQAGYENADHSIESVGDLAPEPSEQPRLIYRAMIDEALR